MKLKLSEEFLDTVKAGGQLIDVYKNPTAKEYADSLWTDDAWKADPLKIQSRGVVDKGGLGNVYIWNTGMTHDDGMRIGLKGVRLSGDILPIYIVSGNKVGFSHWSLNNNYRFAGSEMTATEMKKQIKDFWAKNVKGNKKITRFAPNFKVLAKDITL